MNFLGCKYMKTSTDTPIEEPNKLVNDLVNKYSKYFINKETSDYRDNLLLLKQEMDDLKNRIEKGPSVLGIIADVFIDGLNFIRSIFNYESITTYKQFNEQLKNELNHDIKIFEESFASLKGEPPRQGVIADIAESSTNNQKMTSHLKKFLDFFTDGVLPREVRENVSTLVQDSNRSSPIYHVEAISSGDLAVVQVGKEQFEIASSQALDSLIKFTEKDTNANQYMTYLSLPNAQPVSLFKVMPRLLEADIKLRGEHALDDLRVYNPQAY